MRTGNVIKAPDDGGLWIVTDVSESKIGGTVEAISFDMENCSAVQRLDDHDQTRQCGCESYDSEEEYVGNDPECPDCHGKGSYVVHIKGWKRSKVLANTVQEFILNGVKKGFGM